MQNPKVKNPKESAKKKHAQNKTKHTGNDVNEEEWDNNGNNK